MALAYLLDTTAWNVFGNSNAKYAIGDPSIELLFDSYNNRYDTEYECEAISLHGYSIRKTSSDDWATNITSMLNSSDTLYTACTGTKGYWLASPSSSTDSRYSSLIKVWSAQVSYMYPYYSYCGYRPIVCLKSDVELEASGDDFIIVE